MPQAIFSKSVASPRRWVVLPPRVGIEPNCTLRHVDPHNLASHPIESRFTGEAYLEEFITVLLRAEVTSNSGTASQVPTIHFQCW